MAPAVRPDRAAMCRRRRSRTAASACSARCSRPTPISAASSPAASSPAASRPTRRSRCSTATGNLVEQGRVSKILAFRGIERVPIDEAEAGDIVAIAGLPKFNVADTLCAPEVDRAAAGPADRSADAVDDLPRQRFAARRHRGRQGARAASSATACCKEAEGNVALRVERRAELRRLRRLGPRRIAARHPDRDHAPRRLRARRVAAEGRVPQGRGPASCSSRSRKSSSTSTRSIPASSCRKLSRAQGRDDRDAPLGRRPPAPRLPRADARPDRLSGRTADRHARHGGDEPPVPRLSPTIRATSRAAATAC